MMTHAQCPGVTQQNRLLRTEEGAVSAIVSLKCCGIGHTLRYRCNSMTIVTTYQRNVCALDRLRTIVRSWSTQAGCARLIGLLESWQQSITSLFKSPPFMHRLWTATINHSNPGTPGSYFKQYLAEAPCFPAKSRPPPPRDSIDWCIIHSKSSKSG